MIIPKEFMNILDEHMNLSGIVRSTIAQYELVIKESKLEFFPEYTKHDSSHIEAVLSNARDLIGESLYLLGARDIVVLILSILAHDLGMHITFEGFAKLIQNNKRERIKEIDQYSWEEEWSKYLQESKKWSEEQRQRIFGKKVLVVKKPSQDRNEHSKLDKQFIGEFIRRHHSRMAHEIVIFGFPLANEDYLPFAEGLPYEIKDIIGFIARSHGMNLRSTFSYLLEKHHDYRTPYSIKVIYHMVVLRISDYIHVTSDRAPILYMQNSSFSSPISLLEWSLHQAVKDINQNQEDPETLFVNVRPNNSVEFLKIRALFMDIQNELDVCWAVLGEAYGRYQELNQLKISIRRVRSNLENKWYADSLPYLPEKVRFDSDPEVIKLLVSPLYGGNPSYGVRELIQNAVDACNELKHLYKLRKKRRGYTSEIKVSIFQTGSDYYFQIEDNGIGMSAEVIVNYFCKAGASYRNNNDWKTSFTEDGITQIARSGRFGVGALAAFLLGDRIEVTTKNIDSPKGYSFMASLDDTQIEVNSIARATGTTIRIKINEKVLSELKNQVESNYRSPTDEPAWYAWYVLNEPNFLYELPEDWNREGFNKYYTVIDVKDWRVIQTQKYGSVLWNFDKTHYFHPSLICNGLIISDGYRSDSFYNSYPSMQYMPGVVVLDNEGALPLNLTRDKLDGTGNLPFEKELYQSLILDMLAKLITVKLNTIKFTSETIYFRHPILRAENIVDEDGQRGGSLKEEGSLVLSNRGYCLPYTCNIKKLKTNKMVHIWSKFSQELSFDIYSYLECAMIFDSPLTDSIQMVKNELYEESFIHDFRIDSKRVYLPKQLGLALINGEIKMRRDILNQLKIEKELEQVISITMNNPPPATIDDSFFETKDGLKVDTLIEIFIAPKKFRRFNSNDKEKIEALNKFVEDVLDKCFADEAFIPYELEKRKKRFPRAFDFLAEYIKSDGTCK
ncbi:ATP-binding protein [Cohnella cellulosilytica]|uniref:ATP-binding protein n=1 Tax=Cohnella cellulosilytica TaxID=986710 RepID=A0ABW2FEQ9_9BACL